MADEVNDWGVDGCDCDKCLCGGEKKRTPAKERRCSVCGKACGPEDLVTDLVPVLRYNDHTGGYDRGPDHRLDSCKDCREKLGKAVSVWVCSRETLIEFEKPPIPVVLYDFRMDE